MSSQRVSGHHTSNQYTLRRCRSDRRMSRYRGWLLIAALLSTHVQADEVGDSARTIYRCKDGDTVIFSDRPCAAAAEIYEAETPLNTFDAPKSEPRSRPSAVARPRSDADAKRRAAARGNREAELEAKLAEKCQRIQASLRDIRSKMRAGYTAREGERLREREARLGEQRRVAKCR